MMVYRVFGRVSVRVVRSLRIMLFWELVFKVVGGLSQSWSTARTRDDGAASCKGDPNRALSM